MSATTLRARDDSAGGSARAFVVEVEGRAGLAAARGLQKRGYAVTGAAMTRLAPGHWSRSCADRVHVADPYTHADAFLDDVTDALSRRPYAAILPTTDIVLQLISRHRERLPPEVVTGLPEYEVVERCLEKLALVDAAAAHDLSPPPSIPCTDEAQAIAAARDVGFPVVLKPFRSVVPLDSRFARRAARLVRDEISTRTVARALGEQVIVQRFEPSARILAVGGVVTPDGLLAVVVARWHRRWPPLDGATSFCVTVAPPAGLLERVEGVLRALGHVGIFELELLERADGTFAALDLNPRPFGWMALAVRAGANLPAIWCDWVLGRKPAPVRARAGAWYRWEDADLKHLAWQLRRRHLGAAAAVLRPRARVAHAYFELADPGPLPATLIRLVQKHLPQPRTRT